MKLSIIIPVYNEEQTIGEVIERVWKVDLGALDREVIIVNDGSSDGTRRAIDTSRWISDQRVKTYDNPINLGKGAAVRTGLAFATGDILLVQDADLELDPNEYVRLVAPILDGRTDIVYGSRFLAASDRVALSRRVANRFLTTLTNILFGGNLTDMETAYKVFKPSVLEGIRLRCVGFDFEPEVTARMLKSGRRILEVPIGYRPRNEHEGKKIRWIDGVDAVYALLKCRFT
jgi:glycosyltransferase involved in cell wall biosynthesis